MGEAFEEAVRQFEEWCHLLLLDALQRAGFFQVAGQRAAAADIMRLNRRAASAGGHARMVDAALDILLAAGFIRCLPSPASSTRLICHRPDICLDCLGSWKLEQLEAELIPVWRGNPILGPFQTP